MRKQRTKLLLTSCRVSVEETMEDQAIILCNRCLKAIRSRGEEVFVGNLLEAEDDDHLLECILVIRRFTRQFLNM